MTSSLFPAVRGLLSETGLDVDEHPDEGWLEVPGFGENGVWRLVADVHDDPGVVVLHSLHPEPVREERRAEMALLVVRLNQGLLLGSFDLDLDTGQIGFRTSLPVPGGEIDPAGLETVIGVNLVTFDRWLPAIEAVRDGTPAAGVAIG